MAGHPQLRAPAHRAGLKVVPYTLNKRTHVRLAARRGVDALITDDPRAARRWLP